jgi:hypothetical protein
MATEGDEVWSAVAAYAADDANRGQLANAVSVLVGRQVDPSDIYVAKLTNNGLHNQVWQGKTISSPHELFIFLDQTSNPASVDRAVRDRLSPSSNGGFDTIVIGKPRGNGWEVDTVVEYDHASIGERLAALLGQDLHIIKVPDPIIPADATAIPDPMPPRHPVVDGGADDEQITAIEVIQHLSEAKNVVLEGAPGTGKTRLAFEVVDELAQGAANACRFETILDGRTIEECAQALQDAPLVWEVVQLHPAFGYDEFVRGLRTDPASVGFSLRSVDGILPQIARVAQLRPSKPTLLIIDEINRGNLSAILGETIFAIDPAHRGREVRLQHEAPPGGSHSLTVPPNLFLLATMNSADRSIAMLDFAVRRRFRFVRVESTRQAVERFYAAHPARAQVAGALFEAFADAMPQRELRPGHSYFLISGHEGLDQRAWAERLRARVLYELRPLFDEYRNEGIPLGTVQVEGSPDLLSLSNESASHTILDLLMREDGS